MISPAQAGELVGATVRSTGGDKIGRIARIFLDDQTGQPEWATVSTGLFGTRESFLPLAQISFDGTEARVPYDEETVKGAQNTSMPTGATSPERRRPSSTATSVSRWAPDEEPTGGRGCAPTPFPGQPSTEQSP